MREGLYPRAIFRASGSWQSNVKQLLEGQISYPYRTAIENIDLFEVNGYNYNQK